MAGDDKYDQVVSNIKNMIENMGDMRLIIQYLETADNTKELEYVQELWAPYLRDNIILYIRPLGNWGGLTDVEELGGTTKYRRSNKRYPCRYLWTECVITKDGDIFPCCIALANRPADLLIGNAGTLPIKDLQDYSIQLSKLKSGHLANVFTDSCRLCTAYSATPNVWVNGIIRWL